MALGQCWWLAIALGSGLMTPGISAGTPGYPRQMADFNLEDPSLISTPTPQRVVDAMLSRVKVNRDDLVYDLGSGDGRVIIAAAKTFGARGVGIELKPRLVEESWVNARQAGVSDRVQFIEGDIFAADIRPATVVTLYLFPSLLEKLQPKLQCELRPGTRIVSHNFRIGNWKPERIERIFGAQLFFWTVPETPPPMCNRN